MGVARPSPFPLCDFSEHGFQGVIKPLYKAVGLRMVGCGSYGLYLYESVHLQHQ